MKTGGGSIVNISSMNCLIAGAVGYTNTKFAVRGVTKSAVEVFYLSKNSIEKVTQPEEDTKYDIVLGF